MWKSAAVGVIVVAILASLPAALSAQSEDSPCHCCWEGTPAFSDDTECSEAQVAEFATARLNCQAEVESTFSECSRRCAPVVAGRCAFIRGCLDDCRRAQARQSGICWKVYKRQIRRNCGPAFRQVQKSLRRCKHGNSLPFPRACDCVAAATSTTTSSPSSTTTSSPSSTTTSSPSTTTPTTPTTTTPTTPTTTVTDPGGSTTSTTTTIADMSLATKLERGTTAQTRNCQTACVNRIVIQCYRDCRSSCGVDFVARRMCNRFCRNANCRFLRLKCTSNDSTDSGDYRACCMANNTCDEDKDEEELCEVTTTTTSSTSTTTTAPSTTTTSLFFGTTLTTSTSTLAFITTTTSTL